MSSQTAYPPERIERAARIYHSTGDAAAALGIAPSSFGRLCRRYGSPPPDSGARRLAGPLAATEGMGGRLRGRPPLPRLPERKGNQ